MDRGCLTRSAIRADGTSEAGVFVTDLLDDVGANGIPRSADDPSRVTRSHVEKGAVNGDKISTISQLAAIFVGIGSDRAYSKKSATRRAIACKKNRNGIAKGVGPRKLRRRHKCLRTFIVRH